jgi:cytochrome P450
MKSGDGGSVKGLTEEEIYGNIFVYNFAGHDTTATTLNWALYLLAAFPEVKIGWPRRSTMCWGIKGAIRRSGNLKMCIHD